MKKLKQRIAMFLCAAMIIPSILGVLPCVSTVATANAATKTTIADWCKKKTIGIQGTAEYIFLDNAIEGAKYTYTSSNKKVVSVSTESSDTTRASLKGFKKGTATITVKQTLKKKTTKIGTVKVTVKSASINKDADYKFSIGKLEWEDTLKNNYTINQMNYKATYTFTSSDPDTFEIKSDGTIVDCKKAGEVFVTIKETYNIKSRTMGKIKVEICTSTLDTSSPVEITTYNYFSIFSYLYFVPDINKLEITITDASGKDASSLIEKYFYEGETVWYGDYHTLKAGTVYISVFDKTTNTDLGKLTVNIK